jgi:hypothetical protein
MHKRKDAMQTVVEITVMAAAVVWSVVIILALLKANLHRTPLCGVAGLGVTAMVWQACPVVNDLPRIVGFAFWIGMSLMIYYWPTQFLPDPPWERTKLKDTDRLDQFFDGE